VSQRNIYKSPKPYSKSPLRSSSNCIFHSLLIHSLKHIPFQPITMKFTAALVALVSGLAMAAPIEESAAVEKRNPSGINYVQNYNGKAAGFQSSLSTGKFSLKWNSGTDVVAGLGWTTGSARYELSRSRLICAMANFWQDHQVLRHLLSRQQRLLPRRLRLD
jgi:hypothetical protein